MVSIKPSVTTQDSKSTKLTSNTPAGKPSGTTPGGGSTPVAPKNAKPSLLVASSHPDAFASKDNLLLNTLDAPPNKLLSFGLTPAGMKSVSLMASTPGATPGGLTPIGTMPFALQSGKLLNLQGTPGGLTPVASPLDGKIGPFKQGINDAWLLTDIDALAQDPEGDLMIHRAITDNGDGSYTVNFEGDKSGDGKNILVTADQLKNNAHSSGDLKVQILEEGFRQFADKGLVNGFEGLLNTGGVGASMLYALAGDKAKTERIQSESINRISEIANTDKDGLTMTLNSPSGTNFTITNLDMGTGTVSYHDPKDTSETKTMSLDQLQNILRTDPGAFLEYSEISIDDTAIGVLPR